MTSQALVYCFIAALCFGGWPLILHGTKLSSVWVAALISVGTLPVVLSATAVGKFAFPPTKLLILGLCAGLINGVGLLAYGKLISSEVWEVSRTIPAVLVFVPVILLIGSYICYNEPVTQKKIAGILFGIVGIYLLSS